MTPITEKTIGIDGQLFSERRAAQRHRVFKGATIRFNKGYGAMECIVRNQSDAGARLAFGDALAVPAAFDLQVGQEDARAAMVVWRSAREIGIVYS